MSAGKIIGKILLFLWPVTCVVMAGNKSYDDLTVIPYPREIKTGGYDFMIRDKLTLILDENPSAADLFTASELIRDLKYEHDIRAEIGVAGDVCSVRLTHRQTTKKLLPQGYQLSTGKNELVISAPSEEGLFYGTQTLLQVITVNEEGHYVPAMIITDWPDILKRSVHYDTKHHQDKLPYVKSFIKDLARYKINMLVWEWEDKFAYPSHPEIGAPGAFTFQEIQDLTRYAAQYHMQITPLVQGLGHASYILKWPRYNHLREIAASNWEFCPLREGTYDILFDLWKDAIEATPGSEYIHIGSDEVYELGSCEPCRIISEELGKNGLFQIFINRAAEYLAQKNRKTMVWSSPMGWKTGISPSRIIEPAKGLVFRDHFSNAANGLTDIRNAKDLGFETFIYYPNAGVVPLMVPYVFEINEEGERAASSLEKAYQYLSGRVPTGSYAGIISAAWDDDALHNQMWMMHFLSAAAWSWNAGKPSPDELRKTFYVNYYGRSATRMDELFTLLNEGSYFFAYSMERNVWHYGEIGQTHLPDLPRGDAIEYDPFWNTEYRDKLTQSAEVLGKMERALQIIKANDTAGIKHDYDLEIFRTSAEMIRHTCLTYLDLSNLEYAISEAHVNRFVDCNASVAALVKAQHIVENNLKRRKEVYNDLINTYEMTQFPKGMSTPEKEYFWQQDRARHFALRRPDMTFLIYDEQLLDMEGYLEKLKAYIQFFKEICKN